VDTPGEERAGGVRPGETVPAAAQTSETKNRDPVAGRNLTPRTVAGVVAIGVFVAVFAAVAVLLILQIWGAVS
jgi:hypothetical protein